MQHLRGLRRLEAVTTVLRRARLVAPMSGVWEAADAQWWWRRPRVTDDLELPVWLDDEGPIGAALLTDWGERWQVDAVVVPGAVELGPVWTAAVATAESAPVPLEVLVRDDDPELLSLVVGTGFEPTADRSGLTSMDVARRPAKAAVPQGYRIVDRASRPDGPHPMAGRNGPEVERRLRETSLYDPTLDLCIETDAGEPAGYALFWADPATGIGMLEPMRVEDAHQRQGLARALLTEGLDRLATKGAERLKVGFDGPAGEGLYLGVGFAVDTMVRSYLRPLG